MSGFQWFQFVQTALMAIAATIVAGVYRGFATGKWVQKNEDTTRALNERMIVMEELYSSRQREMAIRLDSAGEKMSSLNTKIQAIPDTLRVIFLPRELFDEMSKNSMEDRRNLRENIEDLWHVIRQIQQGPRSDDGPRRR